MRQARRGSGEIGRLAELGSDLSPPIHGRLRHCGGARAGADLHLGQRCLERLKRSSGRRVGGSAADCGKFGFLPSPGYFGQFGIARVHEPATQQRGLRSPAHEVSSLLVACAPAVRRTDGGKRDARAGSAR